MSRPLRTTVQSTVSISFLPCTPTPSEKVFFAVWLAYTEHLKERFMSYEVGAEKKCMMEQRARDAYEAAVKAHGLNIAEGHRVWASYR